MISKIAFVRIKMYSVYLRISYRPIAIPIQFWRSAVEHLDILPVLSIVWVDKHWFRRLHCLFTPNTFQVSNSGILCGDVVRLHKVGHCLWFMILRIRVPYSSAPYFLRSLHKLHETNTQCCLVCPSVHSYTHLFHLRNCSTNFDSTYNSVWGFHQSLEGEINFN